MYVYVYICICISRDIDTYRLDRCKFYTKISMEMDIYICLSISIDRWIESDRKKNRPIIIHVNFGQVGMELCLFLHAARCAVRIRHIIRYLYCKSCLAQLDVWVDVCISYTYIHVSTHTYRSTDK